MAQVWTYTSSHTLGAPEEVNWVQHGSGISVSFSSGDRFGAQATSRGLVTVYKNSTLVGTVDVTGWPYHARGGYIGLWMVGNALHETILTNDSAGKSYQDYALGVEGVIIGKALRVSLIKPSDVSDIVFNSLSPGSYSSYSWEHPVPSFPHP